MQPVSPERLENFPGGTVHDARGVEVLDADEPAPSRAPREEKRPDRGDEAAEVERARGRWRETADDVWHGEGNAA
jgi:hypothetical protein